MPKYHLFTARCEGRKEKQCVTLDQAKKFLPAWLLDASTAQKREGVTATITHSFEDIDDESIAKKRGLALVKNGPDGRTKPPRGEIVFDVEPVGKNRWELVEVKPLTKAEIAQKAKEKAESLRAQADAAAALAAAAEAAVK